jgi:hypothetical protein
MASPAIIGGVVDLLSKGIDRIFPDKVERDKAKLALLQAQQAGELAELEAAMNIIVAEASSKDPWTSRARPSFLYVIYVLILASIPMGILTAFYPTAALAIINGYKEWLAAIPSDMWWLFGAGYLGYAGARTLEKTKGVAK